VTEFVLDGVARSFEDDGSSLLDVLREQFGCRSAKDGCAPQGQCGCCTVWVDGAPRVSCVTPARRVAGRSVTTLEGLEPSRRARWSAAMTAAGASQCGFCTPGIVMRLAALEARPAADEATIRTALAAHLCRCTGWTSIVDAARAVLGGLAPSTAGRDPVTSAWRAEIEGRRPQMSGPEIALGDGRFADDTAPAGCLVALPTPNGGYAVGASLPEARAAVGKVQGRRSTLGLRYPLAVPEGAWALTLRTTWVEPAYLEPDASWCRPGGPPASPLANGGAFGAKLTSPVPADAEHLAGRHGRAVRVLWPREEVVRRGPKRPPVAAGISAEGRGVMAVARAAGSPSVAGLAQRVALACPGLEVHEVPVAGPPTSGDLRAAGWAEAAVLAAALGALGEGGGPGWWADVTHPEGGRARAAVAADGSVALEVWAGELLDEVTLRSYCLGAVHQALGWVFHEGLAVDEDGEVQDLTIRSFGILSARETPAVRLRLHPGDGWPVAAGDAVFAAVAAAAWVAEGLPDAWPTRRVATGLRGGG
jgi:xanthine dehydrogenase small subunit